MVHTFHYLHITLVAFANKQNIRTRGGKFSKFVLQEDR